MKEIISYIRDWFMKANNDLKVALREMEAMDPATDVVCFHFQQSVEKMLKAWLIWKTGNVKPIHNIEVLLTVCEAEDPTFSSLRGIEDLTPYAVEIRYPDDMYFPTVEEMKNAARLALATKTFVAEKFQGQGISVE